MIKRNFYLNQMTRNMWNGEIKVITGIRRCGKSVLLFDLFYDYLIENGTPKENIIKIELDQRKFYKFRNPITLCEYIESVVTEKENEKFYLFIDEVQFTQKIVDKENGDIEVTIYDMLNELKAYKNLDVYVTGSNSKMLSSDIATEFRGRAAQIRISPLSFEEFYAYKGGDEKKALDEYMLYGGLPRVTQIEDENDKKNYITSLYGELYIKDIVERNGIEREDILEDILDFLASQIGSLTNPLKLSNTFRSVANLPIADKTVSNYLAYLEDAFLVDKSKRYDVKGKKYLSTPSKYYFTDLGLRNAALNFRQQEENHIMENVIYLELLKRGFSVDVGIVETSKRNAEGKIVRNYAEVDFIANRGNNKFYIQSAFAMDTDEKQAQEKNSLLNIKDFFKKIIVVKDDIKRKRDENGIVTMSIYDFLLDETSIEY